MILTYVCTLFLIFFLLNESYFYVLSMKNSLWMNRLVIDDCGASTIGSIESSP